LKEHCQHLKVLKVLPIQEQNTVKTEAFINSGINGNCGIYIEIL